MWHICQKKKTYFPKDFQKLKKIFCELNPLTKKYKTQLLADEYRLFFTCQPLKKLLRNPLFQTLAFSTFPQLILIDCLDPTNLQFTSISFVKTFEKSLAISDDFNLVYDAITRVNTVWPIVE